MRNHVSRLLKRTAAGVVALAFVGSGLYANAANADVSWSDRDLSNEHSAPQANGRSGGFEEVIDLIRLARTTAPFHNVQNGLDAGWAEDPMCMDYPDGFHGEPPGTMGHHFYNLDYLNDGGRIDATEPELLLYEKRADGSWRFNAVEYIIPAGDLPSTAPPPELFGQEFRFYPEIGANGIWGLHVWLWRPNPHGLYANLNPNVTCEHSDAESNAHH